MQYRHFSEWQRAWLRTRGAEEQRSYWCSQLVGLGQLPPLTDRARPDMWTGRGARHPIKLSRAISRSIKTLSRAHRVSAFMTLLAAFKCLLHRHTQHEDIAVGSLIANRNQIQIERLVGMFANTIVLRTDLSGDPRFSEVLRRVRQTTLDAYRNQDMPIEEILRTLKMSRGTDRNTLFSVMFIMQNASPRIPSLPGLSAHFMDLDPGIARSDLTLELVDADDCFVGWLEYSTDLFESTTIARIAARLRTLLAAIVADPEERISRLALLPAAERRQVLIDWNGTQTRLDGLGTFSERLAAQVARTPDAVAVSDGPIRLSYAELARRASAIADRLDVEQICPDGVVILLGERSVDFLAAMIAMLGARRAFLPLDPTLPTARLTQIFQHCRASRVLVGQGCATILEAVLSGIPRRDHPKSLRIEELSQALPASTVRRVRSTPSSLAYVIYTSGSTGIPKGAMIEHRGLFNHLLSQVSDLELSASDVVAQTAPQTYVISIWQFLAALVVGARVHICLDAQVRDPALLAHEIAREGVTVLQIVPSLLRAIVERTSNEPTFRSLGRLRWLISTGEALATDLCRNWFRHFPSVPLINAYGMAECSDDVATYRILSQPLSLATVPIGRPIANTCLYVLDGHLQPSADRRRG